MEEINTYSKLWHYIEEKYNEEQQIVIENFISYYINDYRGYGHKNCQLTYKEDLDYDTTCELHKVALKGVEFEKNIEDRKMRKNQNSSSI